ncbi:MAG: hypothetical protein IPM54_09055 [Polyangiaceae bacterium]|nr:hypothetical protein [Polyangiaceae bacterium]
MATFLWECGKGWIFGGRIRASLQACCDATKLVCASLRERMVDQRHSAAAALCRSKPKTKPGHYEATTRRWFGGRSWLSAKRRHDDAALRGSSEGTKHRKGAATLRRRLKVAPRRHIETSVQLNVATAKCRSVGAPLEACNGAG